MTTATSLMCLFILFIICPVNAVTLYFYNTSNLTTNGQTTFKFTYTVLGIPTTSQNISTDLVVLATNNFSSCDFSPYTNTSKINGNIIVLESFPSWYACAYQESGAITAVGRLIQKFGGVGVLTAAQESYCEGCVIAYDPSIHIPFVAVQSYVLKFIAQNLDEIAFIEFPAISDFDMWFLNFMTGQYLVARVVISIMYFIDFCLLGYTLYDDFIMVRGVSKLNWHRLSLKVVAILFSAVVIMYLLVDPFSFTGYTAWDSAFVDSLASVLTLLILLLIAQLWIVATGNTMSNIVSNRYFKHIVHAITAVVVLIGLIQGIIPQNTPLTKVFQAFQIIIVILCLLVIIVFGGKTVRILRRGKNMSQDTDPLTGKIIIFIIVYNVCEVTSTILGIIVPMGYIEGFMFAKFIDSVLLLGLVAILFLPPIVRRRISERRQANISLVNASLRQSEDKFTINIA